MSTSDSKPATLEDAAAVIVKKILDEKWVIKVVKKEDPEKAGCTRFVAFEVAGSANPGYTRFVFSEDSEGTPYFEKVERFLSTSYLYGYPKASDLFTDKIHAKITPEDFAALRKKHDEIVERKAAAMREYNLKFLEKYTVEE